MVEWRADAFQHFSSHRQVLHILAALRQVLPDSLLLFTFRTLREGGKHDISDEAYLALNEAVIRSSLADFVDLELFTGTEAVAAAELPAPEDSLLAPLISLARQTQVQTILSSHDFAKTPPMGELLERLSAMEALGCSIAKLAVMPHKKKDVLTLLSATLEASECLDCPVITMSMGALGVISRICGEFFGSCLTFGIREKPPRPDSRTRKPFQPTSGSCTEYGEPPPRTALRHRAPAAAGSGIFNSPEHGSRLRRRSVQQHADPVDLGR